MLAPWAQEEMATVDLHDARLNERLTSLLSDLGSRPTASIPAACGGYNEITAAYRFFDNDKTTPENILQPHTERTRQRMAEQEVVLLVQDTSELDLTRPQQQVQGAGPLDSPKRRGCFVHPLHAFTPDGTPLGTAWCQFWEREDESLPLSAQEKRAARRAAPIEEKESLRWLEGLRQARDLAKQLPGVQCVCIADSEADVYELFAEPRGEQPVHWLIRACQNRALQKEPETSSSLLRQRVLESPVLFAKKITVRGRKAKTACEKRQRRQSRDTREAVVEVRATTVTLRPPPRGDRDLPAVSVNVVLVSEVDAPADEPAIEWLLVTTLPINTVEQVRQVVEYYTVRWMIEVFFRVLKSGCRVEERRFERLDRFLCCAAVYLIVAWRVLYVCRMGRSIPDVDCEALFEASEWKSVWMAVHRQAPPKVPPKLSEMIALIAQLGGYINRPNRKDPPGAQTLWLGMHRRYDFAIAWDTFAPGAKKKTSGLPERM
jgi:hypothetical protein